MLAWLVRGLLMVAGSIASWVVAKDAPQFGLVQMGVGLLLLALVVWIIAFWPERWTHILNRTHRT
jgi:hypothetical protein